MLESKITVNITVIILAEPFHFNYSIERGKRCLTVVELFPCSVTRELSLTLL